MATLLSVNVGMPRNVPWQGHNVYTGIWKAPVDGARMVRRLNIDGDGQGDLGGHGGEQRAVMVYQIDSYAHWQRHFGRDDFTYGQFGENFTVDGLADDEVCIGDRYRIGEAEFEVSQPRVTCFRVGMRLGEPQLPALLVAHHRPGFYLRVITEGRVRAGDEIVRTREGRHALSVAAVDALLYLPDRDLDQLRAAVDIPALSPGWQQSFHELLDEADRGGTAAPPPIGREPRWSGFRQLKVVELVAESDGVSSVRLAAVDGTRLPTPAAGQYLTVRVAGAGDPAPVRSYSLSSDPRSDTYRISVKREPHGIVSGYLNTDVTAGTVLDVAAPRGEFVLGDGTEPVALISGGIGATPVLAMLHQLADEQSTREVWWIHASHSEAEHPFAAESHELLASLAHGHEHVFYSSGPVPDTTTVTRGRLTAEALRALRLPTDAVAYLCGPPAFMSDVTAALTANGIDADHVHTEMFGALAPNNPGVTDVSDRRPHPPPGEPGTGPSVTFARSGLVVASSDRYRSLLELAEACDVQTRWSCRTGVCHTCITTIVTGDVSYEPAPLEPPPTGEVLICCSRASTDVVLDL
ncbi:MAG TPA: MOSC and FAD-binding oxidoreductase domain-containing protein [Micromonosporaceae bacterium]|nr:MOSC and FAD-binding oxidoreductase domain-containing protein [Micromonosporaceae bacterium]